MKNRLFVCLMALLFLMPSQSSAHALSAAFTTIHVTSAESELIYSIDSLSVIEGIGGDKNEDGSLSSEEIKAINIRLEEWVEDSVVLEVDGKEQTPELAEIKLEQKAGKEMLTFRYKYPGYAVGQTIKLIDGIFYEGRNASTYNNFLTIQYDGQVSEAVLNGKNREWAMLLNEVQQQQQADQTVQQPQQNVQSHSSWISFLKLGMNHILTGYDHLLFLFALLIRKQKLKQYVTTITAFTIAHTITLTLSVLGIITLPSRFVESMIALSICYVALENIFKKEIKFRWIIPFGFGLIHGLGFASILKEMNLPKSDLIMALLNFNLGIEIIQLVLVLLLVPVLFKLQSMSNYLRYVNYGSAIIFILGAIWLGQRLFA